MSARLASYLATVLVCGMATPVSAGTVNRIVALVNDEVITEADVNQRVNDALEDGEGALPSAGDAEGMHETILQRLIEQRLILQEAKRAGIVASSDQVALRVDALRKRFATEEEFQQSLVDSNLNEEQLKEKIRDQLLVRQLIDAKVRAKVVVSPQEVSRELAQHPDRAKPGDRVRASDILVRVGETRSEEQARALIQRLKQQASQGADFAALAKQHSEDPHAGEGGAMGWVAQGELLPELDAALFTLTPGEVSEPIQTRLGFHLLKVEERRAASSLSVTEANMAIYEQMFQQKFERAFSRWLNELKRDAYIEILVDS